MHASIYENGQYLASNPHWHADDAPIKARWIQAILRRNGVSPAHLVDEGCGSGDVLVELARQYPGARMDGYDVSPQAHLIAAPKAGGALTFHHGRYDPAPSDKADLLMAIDVLEHVEDYVCFVRDAQHKATWKLFHIPLDLSVQGVLRGRPLMRAREQVGHLHYFEKDTALALLEDCGHEIVDWNYTHCAETMPDSVMTKVLNVFRRFGRAVNEDFSVRLLGGASIMVLTR